MDDQGGAYGRRVVRGENGGEERKQQGVRVRGGPWLWGTWREEEAGQ